jgi:Tol biopolymer transport system component
MRARTAALLLPAVLVASAVTVTAAATSTSARVVTLPAPAQPYRLGFASDTAPATRRSAIFSTNAAGQDLRQASNDDRSVLDFDPAYSPDGTKVVYAEDTSPDNPDTAIANLVIANADGTNPRPLTQPGTTYDYGPTWSPDGKMVAFDRGTAGSVIDVVRVSDGTEFGPLTSPGWSNFADPAWSPTDPGTIVATAQAATAPGAVSVTLLVKLSVTMNATAVIVNMLAPLDNIDGAACPLPSRVSIRSVIGRNGGDADPAFSPDGGTLAFTSYNAQALCLVSVDGTNGRAIQITNLVVPDGATVHPYNPAFAPDGVLLALELDVVVNEVDTPSIVAVPIPAAPAFQTTQELWVDNATGPAFDPISGPVSLTVTAKPTPGYVGGDAVVVTYTLKNRTNATLRGPTLTATLPAVLPVLAQSPATCTPGGCALADLAPGDAATVRFTLNPTTAVSALATGRATFNDLTGRPTTIVGQAPVVVLQPVIKLDPMIGPPGIVTVVTGRSFPPAAKATLRWTFGISAPSQVTVRADGTFTGQMLVLRNDPLGQRNLVAHRVSGAKFADVMSLRPFLVVPGGPEPPKFFGRG